jgi:hypothetical protein
MYERKYGSRYKEVETAKEAAAIIRKEVRALTKDPDSALYECQVSVRYRSFAGGCAIDRYISAPFHARHDYGQAWPEDPNDKCLVCGTTRYRVTEANRTAGHFGTSWLSLVAVKAIDEVDAIANAFNHNGSEPQVDYWDVRFYGHTTIKEATRDAGVA